MSARSCATIKRLLRKGTRKGAEINYTTLTLVGLGAPCSQYKGLLSSDRREKLLLNPQFPREMHKLRETALPAPRSLPFSTSVTFSTHLCLVPLIILAACGVLKSQTKEG